MDILVGLSKAGVARLAYPREARSVRQKQAVRRNRVLSREGLLERVFERLFRGLVYTQAREDPEIDLEAELDRIIP